MKVIVDAPLAGDDLQQCIIYTSLDFVNIKLILKRLNF